MEPMRFVVTAELEFFQPIAKLFSSGGGTLPAIIELLVAPQRSGIIPRVDPPDRGRDRRGGFAFPDSWPGRSTSGPGDSPFPQRFVGFTGAPPARSRSASETVTWLTPILSAMSRKLPRVGLGSGFDKAWKYQCNPCLPRAPIKSSPRAGPRRVREPSPAASPCVPITRSPRQ